jgi:TATA-binding protein-associated factor
MRAAASVAAFVEFTGTPFFTAKVNPSDKVIKNLFTFLCQDTSINPVFSDIIYGILSLKEEKVVQRKGVSKDVPEETDEQIAMRITRRGASAAFRAMARRFGGRLFQAAPKFWEAISGPLLISGEKGESGSLAVLTSGQP